MFSAKGRTNRVSFIVQYFGIIAVAITVLGVFVGLNSLYQVLAGHDVPPLFRVVLGSIIVADALGFIWAYFVLLARRVQDIGISKYWILLLWLGEGLLHLWIHHGDIPFADITLAIIPGASMHNKYGPEPKPGIDWKRLLRLR